MTLAETETELIRAIKTANNDEVKRLLKTKSVDPNKAIGNDIPIIHAAKVGCPKVLKTLHRANCCLTAPDLQDYNWKRQPIHIAAGRGHVGFVKKLIKYGVAVDARDKERRTPLHWGATEGQEKMCEYLIAVGADVNATQIDGITPLQAAIYGGHFSTCRLLIEKMASVLTRDRDGWTPFHTAVCYKNLALLNLLLQSGANVHSLTEDNENAVHIAASIPSQETLQYLINLNIDTDKENKHGHTPFFITVSYNIFENGITLVKTGTKFKRYLDEFSPLKVAAHRGYKNFIYLMLNNGYNCSCEKWIQEKQFPSKISNNQDICKLFEYHASTPQSLKMTCIFSIRDIMQKNLDKVESLQLPESLKYCLTTFIT